MSPEDMPKGSRLPSVLTIFAFGMVVLPLASMVDPLRSFLDWVLWFLSTDLFLKLVVFPGVLFVSGYVIITVWGERKLLARVMLRIGPLHVGRYAGSLQVIADFLKLVFKEIIIPRKAHKWMFLSMPVLGSMVFMLPLALIPFAENWVVYSHPLSLLFVFAIISMGPMIILLTGWSQNNKYSFIGGLREAFQMIAYEIPLILSAISVVVLSRSLDLMEIVKSQSSYWYALALPIGFLVFFISGMAETARSPFDIPEAEQEIVIGWMTEYSGIVYGLCYMLLYEKLLIFALLTSLLFLGGWYGPFLPLPQIGWVLLKVALITITFIVIRGAYPRFRLDQLLRIGWKVLIPLAVLNLLLAVTLAGGIL